MSIFVAYSSPFATSQSARISMAARYAASNSGTRLRHAYTVAGFTGTPSPDGEPPLAIQSSTNAAALGSNGNTGSRRPSHRRLLISGGYTAGWFSGRISSQSTGLILHADHHGAQVFKTGLHNDG